MNVNIVYELIEGRFNDTLFFSSLALLRFSIFTFTLFLFVAVSPIGHYVVIDGGAAVVVGTYIGCRCVCVNRFFFLTFHTKTNFYFRLFR